jgi:hypothetical protein
MSDLPYLCHFRIIIHIWKTDKYDDDETLEIQTWTNSEDFIFRGKKQFEKDQKDLLYWLKQSEGNDKIKFSKGTLDYITNTRPDEDTGYEHLNDSDLISRIIEGDIKVQGNKYYEITGKLHLSFAQDYWGEWDCEEDVSDLKFQEIAEEDVDEWLKDNEGSNNE